MLLKQLVSVNGYNIQDFLKFKRSGLTRDDYYNYLTLPFAGGSSVEEEIRFMVELRKLDIALEPRMRAIDESQRIGPEDLSLYFSAHAPSLA